MTKAAYWCLNYIRGALQDEYGASDTVSGRAWLEKMQLLQPLLNIALQEKNVKSLVRHIAALDTGLPDGYHIAIYSQAL